MTMTKTERDELLRTAKGRTKVAAKQIEQRKQELKAHVETQLATIYKRDDVRWRTITEELEHMAEEADRRVEEICRAEGIPEDLRPTISFYWAGRGQNALKARRDEMRKAYFAQIDSNAAKLLTAIETRLWDFQFRLAAKAIESDEARALLAEIQDMTSSLPLPTIEGDPLQLASHVTDNVTDDVTASRIDVTLHETATRNGVTDDVTASRNDVTPAVLPIAGQTRKCPVCGTAFVPKRSDQEYDRPSCRQKAFRQRGT
jgi:hypothetical protein